MPRVALLQKNIESVVSLVRSFLEAVAYAPKNAAAADGGSHRILKSDNLLGATGAPVSEVKAFARLLQLLNPSSTDAAHWNEVSASLADIFMGMGVGSGSLQ